MKNQCSIRIEPFLRRIHSIGFRSIDYKTLHREYRLIGEHHVFDIEQRKKQVFEWDGDGYIVKKLILRSRLLRGRKYFSQSGK